MKKNILLSLVLLLSCTSAIAENWQYVDVNNNEIELYVDLDSLKTGKNNNEYLYAARYSVKGAPEKVVYLKSDIETGKLGIIRADDYTDDSYRPVRNLSNPHVYMKDVNDRSFLKPLHEYVLSMAKDNTYLASQKNYDLKYSNDNLVYNSDSGILREEFISYTYDNKISPEIRNYLITTCEQLKANWMPPNVGYDTRTIVKATIKNDGSLFDYSILETSGNLQIDNSVVKALKTSVPYAKLPKENGKEVFSMDFKFVFEGGNIAKRVVY